MNFKPIQNGLCDCIALLKKCEEKTSKNGSKYLDLILSDKDGEIPAKLWDQNGGGIFSQDMIVKVRGNVEQYNGRDQFRIAQIRPVSSSDEYTLSDLVPASEIGGEQLYNMLMSRVNEFKDADFKAIVTDIMSSNKEKLIKYPAALKLHHAIVGGLMLHTMSIVKMAEQICTVYPNINSELLLSGAILHDAAKIWELETNDIGLAKGYTASGELIGHLVKGAMYIDSAAKKHNVPEDKAVLLEHMLLSHHGQPEFGSPVRPMFVEAVVLSALDALDANIFEVLSATGKTNAGEFTERQWALDNRKLYNHGLSDAKYKVNFD